MRQWQELFYNKRYSHTCLKSKTDFVKLAKAFGAVGIRVTKANEIRSAIEEAMEVDETVVIDIKVEGEENVFPMVPPGASIRDMIG